MSAIITFYLIFLIAYLGYSGIGIYHLWRFGYVGDLTKPAIILYLVASIGVVIFSILLLGFEFRDATQTTVFSNPS